VVPVFLLLLDAGFIRSGETKVTDLEFAIGVNEEIAWFEISVVMRSVTELSGVAVETDLCRTFAEWMYYNPMEDQLGNLYKKCSN
jgi:hypothetical protein